ncbi:MAG: hypothetical protein IV101_15650 [Dechloromonas sp.]|nr:hypothetical protein [Dechloromonas sp.]
MADVSSSYAVWRELTDADNRDRYDAIKAQYGDFFITIERANLAMVVNGLYMLLEGRKDTDNLQLVLERQKKLGRLYEGRVDKWLEEIKGWKPLSQKIIYLRSNIFAHRGGKKTSSEFARHAAITPDEIGDLIERVEKLLKKFAEAVLFNTAILPFSGSAKGSTKDLMKALRT